MQELYGRQEAQNTRSLKQGPRNRRLFQRTYVLQFLGAKKLTKLLIKLLDFLGPWFKERVFCSFLGVQEAQNTRSLEQPSISSLALHKAPYKAPNAAPERASHKAPQLSGALFQRTCVLQLFGAQKAQNTRSLKQGPRKFRSFIRSSCEELHFRSCIVRSFM